MYIVLVLNCKIQLFRKTRNITKKEIWNASKYDRFDDYYAIIDVSERLGFEKLLERIQFIMNLI